MNSLYSKSSELPPNLTSARAIGNLWNIRLGINTFNAFRCDGFNANIPFLKTN